jgi:hypothetical protein
LKSTFIPIVFLITVLLFTGCAYVDIRAPFDTDLNQSELGTKKGTSDAYCVLWLVAWGDASYAKAAENGDIQIMKHADQEIHQIFFGCYTHWKVIVYGD